MSLNVDTLLDLFPRSESGQKSYPDAAYLSATIRGKCHYDPEDFDPKFSSIIDDIRADPRWGPIYLGDLSRYDDDQSKADLALCGEFARRGMNAGSIDTAFRTSGLYREKWERNDYREKTISKALEGVEPAPRQQLIGALLDLQDGQITISKEPPPPRDWILEDLLLSGKSAVLGGFGGVSKTQLAIQLSIAISLGTPFMEKSVKPGKVMLILAEEDEGEITRRVSAVARKENFTAEQVDSIERRIKAWGLVGRDTRLTASLEGALSQTTFSNEIITQARHLREVRLIVLDHLALLHGGDFNAREDAALTMRVVNHIAKETGAAVLVLAHTPKSAGEKEESDASMIAGSTAFVDQARGAWILATMREKEAKNYAILDTERKSYASLTIVKNNYGPTGAVLWFQRTPFDGVGLLEFENLIPPTQQHKALGLEANIVAVIRQSPGQYSKSSLRDSQSGKKGPLKASKAEVEHTIETLLGTGELIIRVPTSDEKQRFGHGPQVRHVLDVGSVK